IKRDDETVEHIAPQEYIGTVGCNAAYRWQCKAFHCHARVIHEAPCVCAIVAPRPDMPPGGEVEGCHKPYRNNRDIGSTIRLAAQGPTAHGGDWMRNRHVSH